MALTFKLARLERPVVPFLGIAVLAFAATGLEPSDTNWSLVVVAAFGVAVLAAVAAVLPWSSLPSATLLVLPVSIDVAIALLRQAQGGSTSGYGPLVILPIVWVGLTQGRRAVAAMSACTALVFALPVVAATPAAAATSVAATPDTDLVDGQTVVVSGSGWRPGGPVAFCEGVMTANPSQGDCRSSAYQTATADAQGNFSGNLKLQRVIFVPSKGLTIDCANPGACVVAAADPNNVATTAAYGPLQFRLVPPTVVPAAATEDEGNSGAHDAVIPVRLSSPSDQNVTVEWTTVHAGTSAAQAEPPVDYTATSGVVTFTPGQTSQSVSVSVNGDTDVEPDEYFLISFHNPTNATIGGFYGLGVGIISNDD